MKIKQELKIKKFLINYLGLEKGTIVFNKQKEILDSIISNTKNKTKNQIKTLNQTIYPRIALYKALIELRYTNADKIVRNYMIEVIAKEKHHSTERMEKVPGFYYLYSNIFLKIMKTTDLQVSETLKGKDYYDVTIKKCLWHDACVENDCANLCKLFCDVDDVTYGDLKKLAFQERRLLAMAVIVVTFISLKNSFFILLEFF